MINKLKITDKTKAVLKAIIIDIGLSLLFAVLNFAAYEAFVYGFLFFAVCVVLAAFYAVFAKLYGGSFIKTAFIQFGGYVFCAAVVWFIIDYVTSDSDLKDLAGIAGLFFLVLYIGIFILSLIFSRIYLLILSRVIQK